MYDKKILSHSAGFLNNIKDKSMYKLILNLFKYFLPESCMDLSLSVLFFLFFLSFQMSQWQSGKWRQVVECEHKEVE